MRLYTTAAAYALWLLAIEVIFYLAHGDNLGALEFAVGLGVVPAGLQILLLGLNPLGLAAPVQAALWFVLIVLVGYLTNVESNSIIYLIELLLVFGIAILVAGSPDRRLIRTIGVLYAVPAALFIVYIAATGEYLWGRLTASGIQPNWWGLMGGIVVAASFAYRSRLLTVASILAGLYVAYAASSRNSMVGIAVAVFAVLLMTAAQLRGRRLIWTLVGAVAAFAFATIFLSSVSETLNGGLVEALQLDDPGRGLGTGFSGRADLWDSVAQIWLRSPLFGVGFRQHQSFMPALDQIGAHNAYLAMLADTGILGLLWYLGFVVVSLYASLGIRDARSRNVVVATIVSYAVIGIFEARGINGGNPFSIYFQMCCFFALTDASLRRVQRHSAAVPVAAQAKMGGSSLGAASIN
jgi:O-antigen ligase